VLDTVVARALDHLGVEHALVKRWGSADPPKEAR
jgi:3-polyprenyl-4-hydroxybenzoate decarboxylase